MDRSEHIPHPFWDMLTPDTQAALRNIAKLERYSHEQIIHNRGDIRPGISIVKSGAAQVGTLGVDGSFMSIATLDPGESFGEFTLFVALPRTHDISAIGTTEIYQITAEKFIAEYNQRPDISRALLVTSLYRSHLLLEMVDDMRRLSLPSRIAKHLLVLSGETGTCVIACQQTDIAHALGVSRVSIGKGIKQLTQYGFIRQGYGEITLIAPERLQHWVTEQSAVAAVSKV